MKKIKKPLKVDTSKKISDFFKKQDKTCNGESSSNGIPPNNRKRKLSESPQRLKKSSKDESSINQAITSPAKHPLNRISVKTPDKLLTPEALKALNRSPSRPVTPRNIFKDNASASPKLPTPSRRTPNKLTTKTDEKTPNKSTLKTEEKTPNKQKRSPKKLFEKSPKNLNEFNIEVISDFVKITPSKSMNKQNGDDCIFVSSTEKKQASILKFMSPKQTGSSKKSQVENEMTPTKPHVLSPVLSARKAKTKLSFSTTKKCDETVISHISPETKENCGDLSNIDYNFDDSWDGVVTNTTYNLNLSELQYCKVVGVKQGDNKIILTVKSLKDSDYAICDLMGFWMNTMLNVDDTVRVTAEKNENNEWVINNDHGYLIYEPDVLLSTTSIVGAVFCKRKAVLVEKFRGSYAGNKFMLVGTLVHNIFQTALKSKENREKEIKELAETIMYSKSMIKSCYESSVNIENIKEEVLNFMPKIAQFIDTYLFNKNTEMKKIKDNFRGKIDTIDDIEENIWCPNLGMKGKIDVSVRTNKSIKPLELKTGRATVSIEHRGQVIMYIMMLNQLGIKVPSGLLLYLKEGILREIPETDQEKRDLIILRNELTYYLTRKPTILQNDNNESSIKPAILPEPINASVCSKCDYNIICATYLKYNKEESSKYLRTIQEQHLSHLNQEHLDYFMLWVSLLALEANSQDERRDVRNIYTLKPSERETNGTCLANLKVSKVEEVSNDLYEHTFKKQDENCTKNFLFSSIIKNKYVVVSTNTRPAVASGFVTDISLDQISITLDRKLLIKFPQNSFHIDMYDSNSIQNYNLSNLTLLLEESERAEQLRNIIINKKSPTFESKLPKIVVSKGASILKRLNKVQQRAVLKALAANEYLLIKGMPGTGKTETIVALIQLLEALGKTILLTSHTHTAVDNVCLRLIKYGVKLMRLGSDGRMDPELRPYSEHTLTENCKTTDELELVYNTPHILAVTCLGATHPILSKRTMDVCIVDESTQVLQCSVLKPLFSAKTFILIGDPNQLPAVVRNKTALSMGMSESLFDRLNKEEATIALNLNYRMNTPITNLANILTYNGELLVANDNVAKANLNLPLLKDFTTNFANGKWILNTLNNNLDAAVCFLNTGPTWKMEHSVPWVLSRNISKSSDYDSKKCVNIYEAALVYNIIDALLKAGVSCDEVGVITTYRAQVAQIAYLLKPFGVTVSTVDQYQGKDKNVIIYSCVKSEDISKGRDTTYDLLSDTRRLNVAITRAKHKLILIGDVTTLNQYPTFATIISTLEKNTIHLENDNDDFSWNKVLDIKTENEN